MDTTGGEEANVEEYRRTFNKYDPDNTGIISLNDMIDILQKLGRKINSSELKELLTQIGDADLENNNINFDSFVPFMELTTQSNSIYEDEMYLVFQHFDKDGDGYICPEELRDLFSSFGDEITEKDLTDMITEADHDGDGKVSFSDFVKVMTHPHQLQQMEESPSPKINRSCFTLEEAIPEEVTEAEGVRHKFERMEDIISEEIEVHNDKSSMSNIFKGKSKRRQSCFSAVGGRKNSMINVSSFSRITMPRARSRRSCPDIASLTNEFDKPKEAKKKSSLTASTSFIRGLFKKRGK
ncbi:uncharacterized protein LOC120343126 [Styela clava]